MENRPELEGRAAFGGFIGPRRLLSLVENTAPWLFSSKAAGSTGAARLVELGRGPAGWRSILLAGGLPEASESPSAADWTDYFALCVACHFASVGSFVPTDVDTKIRSHLWFLERPADELERMKEFALGLAEWDVHDVSARIVETAHGPVSGHDGERLSVLGGGLLGCLREGDSAGAGRIEEAIAAELDREARAFSDFASSQGSEPDLLRLAATLTHNAGDLDQGLSAEKGKRLGLEVKERFMRLAHERPERFGGAFARAALLYRELLSAEGHRNYPLREIRPLREHPALLLPLGPFLDRWGALLAGFERWDDDVRASVVDGVIQASRKVPGQIGYFRALAGFDRAHPDGLFSPRLERLLGANSRRELKSAALRQRVAIRRESFESSLAKRTRALLASSR